jgi:ribosomal protein S12 methylthiotransferase
LRKASFHIVTLGCDKNTVDSEGVARLLEDQGLTSSPDPAEAAIIVVNTCGFINIAREESIAVLKSAARRKKPGQALIAAGCLAELQGEELKSAVPQIDAIVGSARLGEIGSVLAGLGVEISAPESAADEWLSCRRDPGSSTAFVKIAEGCNSACCFCSIPLIKGPYRSKPPTRIVDEVSQLAERGVKEVVLVAQDTAFYGSDLPESMDLPGLIEQILAAAPALPRLRLMYTYPQRVTERLLQVMAANSQVCRYLDLPLQHSHPAVLRRMGRPSDSEKTRELIAKTREIMPDIALRTTFIVGYPGETEEEFKHLIQFIKEVQFDHAGAFAYSREAGTAAAALPGRVSEKTKQARLNRLLETQSRISLRRNQSLVGTQMPVLIEGLGEIEEAGKANEPIAAGRGCRHAPEVDGLVFVRGTVQLNEIVQVIVRSATEYDLWAETMNGKS